MRLIRWLTNGGLVVNGAANGERSRGPWTFGLLENFSETNFLGR